MKRRWNIRLLLAVLGGGGLFAVGYYFGSLQREEGTLAERTGVSRPAFNADSKRGMLGHSGRTDAAAAGEGAPRNVASVLAIIQSTNPIDRMARWTRMLQATDAAGLQVITEAFEELYRMGGTPRDEETSLLHFRQGQLLGSKYIEGGLPPSSKFGENHRRMMRGWADADPQTAKAWVDALEESPVKQSLLECWFQGVAGARAVQAAEVFPALSESTRNAVLPSLIAAIHREQGTTGVIQWFDQTASQSGSGVPVQQAFDKLSWMVGQEADANPDAALKFLRDPAHAAFLSPASFNTAMRNISTRSPGTAVEVLGEISSGAHPFTDSQVREVLQRIAQNAKRTALNSLGEWLQANPAHRLYDLTTRYFVEQAVFLEDPAAAAAWAGKISDPALRAEASQFLKH